MKSGNKHIDLKQLKTKGTGFIIPDEYFDNFESQVLSKTTHDIPKDYFNNLEDMVFKRIKNTSSSNIEVVTLKEKIIKKYIPILAAASVVLFIGLNFYSPAYNNTNDSLNKDSINNWLEVTNYNTSDSYILGEFLNDDDFYSLTIAEEENLDDNQLINYLNSADIDNLIINN